jgi:hypothetical protein
MPRNTFFLIWLAGSLTMAALGFRGGDPGSPQDSKATAKPVLPGAKTYSYAILCCCDTQQNYYPCAEGLMSATGGTTGSTLADTIVLENLSFGKEAMMKSSAKKGRSGKKDMGLGFQKIMLIRQAEGK